MSHDICFISLHIQQEQLQVVWLKDIWIYEARDQPPTQQLLADPL